MNHADAKTHCESLGKSVTSLTTLEEALCINQLKPGWMFPEPIWTDWDDIQVEGTFVNTDGEQLTRESAIWEGENPDNFLGNENCGALNSNGKLNDVDCDLQFYYICTVRA